MLERPILFNAEMVRAILNGSKTQTRRIVKLPHQNPLGVWEPTTFGGNGCKTADGMDTVEQIAIWHTRTGDTLVCPHGQVGDHLWVREAHGLKVRSISGTPHEEIAYRATDTDGIYAYEASGKHIPMKWKPSIYMPRWASRIQLEITNIRVERLNNISEEDAIAEGVEGQFANYKDYSGDIEGFAYATGSYRTLWESINGAGSWAANPWVWVIEFKRI